VAQVRRDVGRLRDVGVTEIITWSGGASIAALRSGLERVRDVVGLRRAARPTS
jgi:hypothetical protein